MSNDEMLAASVVAERFGVNVRSIQRWCKAGKFPGARKLNPNDNRSPYIIPLSAVEALERQRAAESNGNAQK